MDCDGDKGGCDNQGRRRGTIWKHRVDVSEKFGISKILQIGF